MGTTAQKLAKLAEVKENIRLAINEKGVEVSTTDTFATYSSKIAEITTGIEPTGNIELQQSTETDVTQYATATVKTGSSTVSGSGPASNVSLDNTTITLTRSVTPTVVAGWVEDGTAGNVTTTATVPTEAVSVTDNGEVTPSVGKLLRSVSVNIPYKVYYIGEGLPDDSFGNDGDIYIDIDS